MVNKYFYNFIPRFVDVTLLLPGCILSFHCFVAVIVSVNNSLYDNGAVRMYQRCAVVCPAAVSTKDVMKGVWKSSTRTDGEPSATGRSETSKLASSATVSASPGWLPASNGNRVVGLYVYMCHLNSPVEFVTDPN